MQTPSHLLSSIIINRYLPEKSIPKHTIGFLIGSVLPDIPFALLTLTYEIYYQWFAVVPSNRYDSVMEYLHFDLFFNDPIWIIGHNTFHSLIVNSALLIIGYMAFKRGYHWGLFLFWLSIGMLLHTTIDIVTHSSDGPLIFFPLNWTYRFSSPVSYWESNNFGGIFIILEYTMDMLILLYFAFAWWKQRITQHS